MRNSKNKLPNETIQELVEKEEWDQLEDYMTKSVFDKPNEYFNLEKLESL